jgi:RNA polymerase sigma-70 factor, ECF subfamily
MIEASETPTLTTNLPSMHPGAEEDLVGRAKRLDEAALSSIFDTYYSRVYNYGLCQLREVQAAEDLASDVMLRVLQSIPRYDSRGVPLSAWVFRIARNRLVDIRRRVIRRREIRLADNQVATAGPPHAAVERALDYGNVCAALSRLTKEQEQVIILRFLNDFDVATVARILGRSESAVKSLQFRALASLRRIVVSEPSSQSSSALGPGAAVDPCGYEGPVAAPAALTASPSSR